MLNSIKEVNQKLEEEMAQKDDRIKTLEQRLAAMEKMLNQITGLQTASN